MGMWARELHRANLPARRRSCGRAERVPPHTPTSTIMPSSLLHVLLACLSPTVMSRCPRAGRGHHTCQGDLAPSWEHPCRQAGKKQSSHRLFMSQPEHGPTKMSHAYVHVGPELSQGAPCSEAPPTPVY